MKCLSPSRYRTPALWPALCLAAACLTGGAALFARSQETGQAEEKKPTVVYSIRPRLDQSPRQVEVSLQVPVIGGESVVRVQMPVWSPGDYHIQNHARYVRNLRASAMLGADQTLELRVKHPDANTWEIDTEGAQSIQVRYSLPETPPGLFSENIKLGDHFTFLNGPALLVYVMGHKDWKASLYVYHPPNWNVETPLQPVESKEPWDAAYSAPDYDTLADSPVVIADDAGMVERSFEVDHIPHRAVFFRNAQELRNVNAYVPVLKRIVQAENDIMGGPPYARYDFFFDVDGPSGGLEHENSARLLLWSDDSPHSFAAFIAHEFFHLWNVKRIRPLVLRPFDYIHPPQSRNLWFAEGVTEYYAHIAVQRAGVSSDEEFLSHFRKAIARMQNNPARKKITAEESSLRVWEGGISEGYGGLSYYDKGELIGLCLDLKIRSLTNNAKSLDDVLRLLMQRHNPPKPGYGEDELRTTISEVAGQDLTDFYNLLARSTQEMPFAECLGYVGLDVRLRPLANASPAQTALRNSWMSSQTRQ